VTLTELRRQLGALDVFAVAAGAMISSGLFILPAIAYAKAGPGVIVSYLLASILILPSVVGKAELATAMPRAGGTYFFVERSFGPLLGLFSGLAGWFSLALKSAFAVVGMAILVEVVVAELLGGQLHVAYQKAIGVACCLVFTGLNIVSVKHTSRLQVFLVGGLLVAPASAVFQLVAPGPLVPFSLPFSLPIPNLAALRGLTVTAQSLHLEATGNLATSRGLTLTVQ